MIGWFPRFNDDGSRLTSEGPNKWQAQWLTRDVEIYHNGAVLVIGGQLTQFPSGNDLAAGGGKWAVGIPSLKTIRLSDGRLIESAALPAINPDGELFYVTNPGDMDKTLVWDGRGPVDRGAIDWIRASRSAVVYRKNTETWGLKLTPGAQPERLQVAPAEFGPVSVETPGGLWVMNYTHTGVIVRPWGSYEGYRFDNGGQTFNPDAIYDAARNGIRVVFTNAAGVLDEHFFSFFERPVDLRAPVNAPPPAPTPAPPPPPVEQPKPPSMPIAPNKIDVVRAVMLQHPEIDRRAEGPFAPQRGGITQLVVQALGGYPWGRKSRDRSATNLSDDALCYRLPDGSFEIYDTISGADGSATWDYAGTFRDGENGYFSTVPVAPQPTPQPPAPTPQPQPQPAPAIECDCAEKLDAALEPLENILQALTIAVADIHSQLKRGFNGSARLGTTMRFDITPKG